MGGYKTNSGNNLKREWSIPAEQVRYHKDGTFYMPIEKFPAAFCDPKGYVLFNSKYQYENSTYLEIGSRVHVRRGICNMPGYIKMK
ncbi:hypothetical protein [Desulfobulbus elongatus]|uniref:hypothetical protein n=1 Tax=Desulfobulbus elongatus TaxID=53332 RepID=UPI0012F8F416|nr:hypothetical protein [Desulfobulbus elongatus]